MWQQFAYHPCRANASKKKKEILDYLGQSIVVYESRRIRIIDRFHIKFTWQLIVWPNNSWVMSPSSPLPFFFFCTLNPYDCVTVFMFSLFHRTSFISLFLFPILSPLHKHSLSLSLFNIFRMLASLLFIVTVFGIFSKESMASQLVGGWREQKTDSPEVKVISIYLTVCIYENVYALFSHFLSIIWICLI